MKERNAELVADLSGDDCIREFVQLRRVSVPSELRTGHISTQAHSNQYETMKAITIVQSFEISTAQFNTSHADFRKQTNPYVGII